MEEPNSITKQIHEANKPAEADSQPPGTVKEPKKAYHKKLVPRQDEVASPCLGSTANGWYGATRRERRLLAKQCSHKSWIGNAKCM